MQLNGWLATIEMGSRFDDAPSMTRDSHRTRFQRAPLKYDVYISPANTNNVNASQVFQINKLNSVAQSDVRIYEYFSRKRFR